MFSGNSEVEEVSAELENHVILRLPDVQAKLLRDVLLHGGNLKERLCLKMDADLRSGTLKFDHFEFAVKLVDLPCIIEAFKTIDKKNIYKTADICQMLVCTLGEDEGDEAKAPKASKAKGKDGLVKVEKKFLWPHGITPPLKNVRKSRFRKILRKKEYSDQAEIEEEVRRLLRADLRAANVSWEVIDEEKIPAREGSSNDVLMQGSKTNENSTAERLVGELFGEGLSDSDGDDDTQEENRGEEIDESRMSLDEEDEGSRLSSLSDLSNEVKEKDSSKNVTAFSGNMFQTNAQPEHQKKRIENEKNVKRQELYSELQALRRNVRDIANRREIKEKEMATSENMALKQRFETVLKTLAREQELKEAKVQEIETEMSNLLKMDYGN